MKLIGCLLLFAVIALSQGKKPHYDLKDAPALFEKFIKHFNRHYKDEADKEIHYQAFVKTLKEVNKFNEESPMTIFDINNFADYTPEQLNMIHGFIVPPGKKNN